MKQLELWQTDSHEQQQEVAVTWQLFIDGASKNNPGPAGAGFVILKNQELICRQGFYLGKRTNNQAEYFALVLGVFFVQKYIKKHEALTIISDSQLLVRQMNGVYKVKDAYLAQLKQLAGLWLQGHRYKVTHVLREHNTLADEMANRGVTTKTTVPQEFLQSLQQHGISY